MLRSSEKIFGPKTIGFRADPHNERPNFWLRNVNSSLGDFGAPPFWPMMLKS